MLQRLFNANRSTKRTITVIYDILAISISLYLAIALRLGEITIKLDLPILASFATTLLISLALMIKLGLYRAILRYAPLESLLSIAMATTFSAIALACSSFFFQSDIPRSSPIIYLLACTILLGAPRILIRNLIQFSRYGINGLNKTDKYKEPVIIYGAGYAGYQLAQNLNNDHKYIAKAFVDDDKKLWGNKLKNINVYQPEKLDELARRYQVKTVLLALGSATRSERRAIVDQIEKANLKAQTIPPINDIISGKARIEDIKPVAIEDLLGRDPVPPKLELMNACIKDKNVMVTGAGGSIGSELCRKIIAQNPQTLVLFELNEFALYQLEQELTTLSTKHPEINTKIVHTIGNIQDQQTLEQAMKDNQIQTIYHAAAYKHVPLVEDNINAGVKNNIVGTWRCAEAAINTSVESFVLISTDKAVRPTNIMGATKRMAELVLQALSQRQNTTRFTMVRFGNVLGSSGSVIPKFKEQIAKGGPITLTHPNIIRYFMTIPEAAELVIQAGAMGKGGDVFVLDMGEPVKIIDLAKRMISLSGMKEKTHNTLSGDIAIEITGLRPGEKLYEELLIGDNVTGTKHPRIMRAEEKFISWEKTKEFLNTFSESNDKAILTDKLLKAPTDYKISSSTGNPDNKILKLANS
ncbi:MAG: nucleoside-diphosphate sugar epimerase/dehydratase [Candidatus Pelagadaptatus aseana]|uniref:polysaccharide biosynthesis protein n=1 Tax=Candidatus Pelagadaptatus aseana TaxID=3120508 RepID=UPI0039B1EA11